MPKGSFVSVAPAVIGVTFFALFAARSAPGQTVWSGLDFQFAKTDYADWTQPENQDRITDRVWLTRQNMRGIFNIRSETAYAAFFSPADTEWADGYAVDWASLDFESWQNWNHGYPPSMIGRDAVVHLISENTYLDIRFLSWTEASGGGGFSYLRAIPEPSALALMLGLAAFAAARRRRYAI